jgi:Zn-dependent protease with chaperone function
LNFFERQDRSRKQTKRLVVLFGLAVASVIVSIYFAVKFFFLGIELHTNSPAIVHFSYWDPLHFAYVAGGTLLVIAIGSLYKTAVLRKGGSAVAEMMGGTPLRPGAKSPEEQKVRNVVEEMAIASGLPVPEIFILENEPGINAFAAGFTPSDAAIGLTKGTITKLNRDELQGVVGHEFSHILNGDMRLNIRLMGILYGILLIAQIGYWMLRGGGRSRGKGAGSIALVAFALLVIGYIGVFFGRLIQAAVCRQREFLADASSVQFTRNPAGIAGALKKIARDEVGSTIDDHHANEISHMTFGSSFRSHFFGLLATHPPIEERIRTLDPSFKEHFTEPAEAPATRQFETAQLLSSIGAPTTAHLAGAARQIHRTPASLAEAVRTPLAAKSLVYALLLSDSGESPQAETLLSKKDPEAYDRTLKLRADLSAWEGHDRLSLVNLALPALRHLSVRDLATFRETIKGLVQADGKVTLFEFALVKMLGTHLRAEGEKPAQGKVLFRSLEPLTSDAIVLLSLLAHSGGEDPAAKGKAFADGLGRLTRNPSPILPKESCDVGSLHRSLDRLSSAAPLLKKEILDACAATVSSDGKVTRDEAELLRAVADTLGTPIPLPLPD